MEEKRVQQIISFYVHTALTHSNLVTNLLNIVVSKA